MSLTESGVVLKGSADEALDKILISQLIWKNPSCVKIGVRICQKALSAELFYPEDIPHGDLPADDVNCVGSLFRYLASKRAGEIIKRTATFKRSDREKAPKANSRTVFAYELVKRGLAEALVRRLGAIPENSQPNLL
jgi:hypothetical protein